MTPEQDKQNRELMLSQGATPEDIQLYESMIGGLQPQQQTAPEVAFNNFQQSQPALDASSAIVRYGRGGVPVYDPIKLDALKKQNTSNKKPTLAENIKLSSTDNVLSLISELQGMYGKEGKGVDFATEAISNLSRTPFVGDAVYAASRVIPGSKEKKEQRQDFTDVVGNLNNNMLYLKSGAQINDKEFARLTKMMPGRWGRANSLDVKQLGRLQREFDILKSRIEQGVKWNSKQKKFLNPDGTEYDMSDVDKQVGSLDNEDDGGVDINSIFGK